jgi:hypothetical protein
MLYRVFKLGSNVDLSPSGVTLAGVLNAYVSNLSLSLHVELSIT